MALFETKPDIMEVTLRDGSYVIDFQFTAEDTAALVSALEAVGFRWIEVGHGLGLNASEKGKRRAAASDEEHLEAAAGAAKSARWGTFFVPGIGRAEDLRLAARYNMSFVRVGTNITEAERARPFIELAKELGMVVCYNAMKSYAVKPAEFAAVAKQTQAWGADMVYIVDSAGTMYPEDVSAFFKAIQDACDVPIGFHGHDNLSLAMANTLQAVECGAAMIDSSLRGMGRSAGNAITEAVVAILKRRGLLPGIDLKGMMDISAGLIEPLVPGRGLDTMAITAGYAGFHSSFTAKVKQYAEQYNVDVRDLIVRLCEEDQIDAPNDLLERISGELARAKKTSVITIPAFGLRPAEAKNEPVTLDGLFKKLYAQAVKAGNTSALNVVIAEKPLEMYRVSANIHHAPLHTIGSVTVSSEAQLVAVLQAAETAVDVAFVDIDRKPFGPENPAKTARAILKQTTLLTYSDGQAWVDAVRDQVVYLLGQDLAAATVVIAGSHARTRGLAEQLAAYGARVGLMEQPDRAASEPAHEAESNVGRIVAHTSDSHQWLAAAKAVVVWPHDEAWFDARLAGQLAAGAYLLDASIGGIPGLAAAQERKVLAVRVNIWPTLAGMLASAHEAARVYSEALGWGTLDGAAIVAGGAIGERGAVIVDSVSHPARIIGVADGMGGLLAHYDAMELDRVRIVTEAINRRRVQPQVISEE
jgi:4-hydroxy-2-oxovalerate aldolase